MRCYSVLIVGNLTHHVLTQDNTEQPVGYAVVRYVLARDEDEARQRAFERERRMLSNDDCKVQNGLISVTFEAEEIGPAPFWHLLRTRYGRAYFETE